MKYLVIGLGYFGATLAQKLSLLGNEVIAVDKKMDKVEAIKDNVTHAICMDCSEKIAVSSLPLKDTDLVVVAIGEDQGASIINTAVKYSNMYEIFLIFALWKKQTLESLQVQSVTSFVNVQ